MNNYVEFTNEELVLLAQEGNKEAKQALMIKNDKLVRYCVNKFFRYESPEFCFDELYNEAVIGFCAAIKNFNGESGQQISTKAQATIWRRMREALGTVDAAHILAAGEAQLQALGMSFRKAQYIMDFAQKVQTGEFDPEGIREKSDEEAIRELSALQR